MAIKEIRTFKNIQDAIIERAKLEDKQSVRDSVQEKINTVYQQIGFEEHYRWSGETKPLKLRAKYFTGTVNITQGLDTVTGSGTSWTRFAHEGSKFYVVGVNFAYKILRVDEGTQTLTLSGPWTGNNVINGSYTIFKDEYGLFPDLMKVRKFWITGAAIRVQPLPCGPNEMDSCRSIMPFRTGTPMRYSMDGKNVYTEKTWATFNIDTDYWEDDFNDQPQNNNLILWPCILSQDMMSMVRYSLVLPPMSLDDEEPKIPYEVRARLVYDVLVEHFSQNRDQVTRSLWKSESDRLKKMMTADIETTDDELVLQVDKSRFTRDPYYYSEVDCERR